MPHSKCGLIIIQMIPYEFKYFVRSNDEKKTRIHNTQII